jgi:hypothetical protein
MAEIRLRDVNKDVMQKAVKVQQILHEKTVTGATERLYGRFLDDQETIRQLQRRNSELHAAIKKYYDKEDDAQHTIMQFINFSIEVTKQGKRFGVVGKNLIKKFKRKGGRK